MMAVPIPERLGFLRREELSADPDDLGQRALADRGHRRLMATTGALLIAVGLSTFALAAPFTVLVVAASVLGGAPRGAFEPIGVAAAAVGRPTPAAATSAAARMSGRNVGTVEPLVCGPVGCARSVVSVTSTS